MTLYVYLVVAFAFALIFTREVIAPASGASCDRRWQILSTTLNVAQATAVLLVGMLFEANLSGHSLLALADTLGPLSGGIATFLVASFIAYWWHRLTHSSDFLWRTVHQLHHCPDRIEVHTAFFAHPLDSVAATAVTSLAGFAILGVDYKAVAVGLTLAGVYNLYIHSDTSSPRWLGYFVQSPEMHRVHHKRDHHAENYGLPLWDLLFGTWENPTTYVTDCGFDAESRKKIKDMLLCRDIGA